MTISEAAAFVKGKDRYNGILSLLPKWKDEGIRKDILKFISFLFVYDEEDINPIIR
jgi:hypothetical protein